MDSSQRRPSKTIAVVESDPALRSSLKFSLEAEGWDVHVFAAAADLLTAVQSLPVDCVIVDHRSADMPATDLVKDLRTNNQNPAVVILAGNPSRLLLRHQAEDQRIAIVEKPLMGNALARAVRDLTS